MEKEKIIPLPKESEVVAIIDEDRKIAGYLKMRRKNHLGKGWVAMYQDGLAWMAEQDLTGEQLRVFMCMTASLDFDNYLAVKQEDIANKLNIPQPHVSRAVRKLKELDILIEGPMAGRCKTYRLNPYIGHKGKNRDQTIVDFQDLQKRKKNKKS